MQIPKNRDELKADAEQVGAALETSFLSNLGWNSTWLAIGFLVGWLVGHFWR